MNREVYLKLSKWREETARREGVPLYRVISTQAVEGIATSMPQTEEELLLVKGIAEKKMAKYGSEILKIVKGGLGTDDDGEDFPEKSMKNAQAGERSTEKVFSVGDFLELLNVGLRASVAKVKGEVSSIDIRPRYIFFGLKDAEDGSSMSIFMWRNDYDLSGVALEEGMEVAVTGFPEIYKPSGRFSFRAQAVELVGKGVLKKAYDKLKAALEKEGIFAEEKKKPIPDYPETIGVITSKTGAVIHDFLNNLGKHGYKIKFYDSRVEGQMAVRELMAGVKYFKKKGEIDVLAIMRGGGSLESLQAFNNEKLVCEVADCPFPVIAGIGHDKDVSLVSLAADKMVSTPTAVTKVLNGSWEQAISTLQLREERIFYGFREMLVDKKHIIARCAERIEKGVSAILEHVRRLERAFEYSSQRLSRSIQHTGQRLDDMEKEMTLRFSRSLMRGREKIVEFSQVLKKESPRRQLERGYSIVFSDGKVVRKVDDAEVGTALRVRVSDGTVDSLVTAKQKEKK